MTDQEGAIGGRNNAYYGIEQGLTSTMFEHCVAKHDII